MENEACECEFNTSNTLTVFKVNNHVSLVGL